MTVSGPVSRVSSAPPSRGVPGLAPLLALGPISLFAEKILATTHHRPLGAVTFAALAVGVYLVCELLVRLALSDDTRLGALAAADGRGATTRLLWRQLTWLVAGLAGAAALWRAL